jgi:uncharacterized phiE125 gp8 family phage protein
MGWTGIKISSAPTIEPVTVAELKTYMSLTGTAFDNMLTGLITACRDSIEKYSGRTFLTTTYELYFDRFPACFELVFPPIQSVTSIYYVNSDGVDTLLTASNYRVDLVSLYPRIEPAYGVSWPSTREVSNAVKVTYDAGYGATAAHVPQNIKSCIMAIASDMFEHRESNLETVNGVLIENKSYKFLLNSFSIPRIG